MQIVAGMKDDYSTASFKPNKQKSAYQKWREELRSDAALRRLWRVRSQFRKSRFRPISYKVLIAGKLFVGRRS